MDPVLEFTVTLSVGTTLTLSLLHWLAPRESEAAPALSKPALERRIEAAPVVTLMTGGRLG
ncbi:MAG: hypothetical protein AAF458_22965 [Pseudomonadota bacterium]